MRGRLFFSKLIVPPTVNIGLILVSGTGIINHIKHIQVYISIQDLHKESPSNWSLVKLSCVHSTTPTLSPNVTLDNWEAINIMNISPSSWWNLGALQFFFNNVPWNKVATPVSGLWPCLLCLQFWNCAIQLGKYSNY